MELHPAAHDVMQLLESASGYPVRVTVLPALDVEVRVQMARGAAPVHHVMIHPRPTTAPDYRVCRECGRILRLFSLPPEQQVEVAPLAAGREAVVRMLRAPNGVAYRYRLDEAQTGSLAERLYGGLMLQLRTTAVGLRVDDWLADRFPDLEPLQRLTARRDLAENLALLEPEARAMAPAPALVASLAMAAAEADHWARAWGEPELLAPYRAPGSFRDGRALMRVWREIPADPAHDRDLVDAWARMVGLEGWYAWRAYQPPQRPAP